MNLEKKFSDVSNDFFQTYLHYKLANIYYAGESVNRIKLFNINLKDNVILYHHPEYMFYFNTFFDNYLLSGSHQINRNDLVTAINFDRTYTALMDTLGKDSLLLNDRLREMVMLKGLGELYNEPQFSKLDIERILKQIEGHSPFPEHQLISKNLLYQLTTLAFGNHAPDFSLAEIFTDSIYTLTDFKKKPVFLNFMTMKSYSCQAEMKIIHELNEQFHDSILFVTICFFDNPETWSQFAQENNYSWRFLWAGQNAVLRNNYRLRTLPLFVLLDRDGRIEEYPARKPSENIEYVLRKLMIR